jgi:Mn-dependent DtxR family transcriptional regulator
MDEKEWEKAAAEQGLFTTIGLAEGEILNFMEGKGEVALTDIVQHLDGVPWSTVIMGIGALIREGLIAYKGQNKYVLLTNKK